MLDYLRVENFAVVEKVELEFSEDLNVLTGETGAGKSILMGAVNLFFTKKIPENAIRGDDPASRLVVEAMFSTENDELVLRREIARKKSQAYVNDRLVPFSRMKELAEGLFTIYGQNEHVYLLNPANHRVFLDEYCGNGDLLAKLSDSYSGFKKVMKELEELETTAAHAAERLDILHFRIAEIEELKMERGEDEQLEHRLKILSSSEEILARSGSFIREVYQSDRSVYNTIAKNLESLDYLLGIYPDLADLKEELHRFYNLLPDLSATLSNLVGKVEYSEDELNDCSDKWTKLNRLKSKYNVTLDELLDKLDAMKQEREQLQNMDFSIAEKRKEVERCFEGYKAANLALRERRDEEAGELSGIIEKELTKLEMPQARFDVRVEHVEPTLANASERGTDKLEFYFSSNPGQALGRIRDIASGGELSRLMLVLKSMLNKELHATYIFDEVDTGIGGKTAEFVGEKLKQIAHGNQVICISHLPQIASFAERHFLITKEFRDGETFSFVKELSEDDRVNEIGRMMAGSAVNGDVLKAAESLIRKNRA